MVKVCIVGWGNIGKSVLEAIKASKDIELCGLIRRKIPDTIENELIGVEVVDNVNKLTQKPQVAILCTPSRSVPDVAKEYIKQGINTVDSFDIHTSIYDLKQDLSKVCKENNVSSIIAAGWDPGTDSVVRALMKAMAPKGVTYTNFGPGMSMGHTVAVKAIDGVKAALSMTIPLGTSIHRRMVYVEIENGHTLEEVSEKIKNDPYFVHDETHVMQVENVDDYKDMGHGVLMERKGVSGTTQNQRFEFSMSINNPALTAQNLVNCARAVVKQTPDSYTMIEIPPIDFLCGENEKLIRELV